MNIRSNMMTLGMAAVLLTTSACASKHHSPSTASFKAMIDQVALVPSGVQDSELLTKVSRAVGFIKRLELTKAQLAINEALQLDPRNAHLHFLNGFVYHLQALQGDTQKGELALEGYQQSLRIDPSNWIAQEFLGLAYMDLKRFNQAKLAFAEVLLLMPDSAPSIKGLMVSAYLTGDAKTACTMADQYLTVSDQPSASFLQSSIPVYASCANFAQADRVRAMLVEHYGETPELLRIDRRVAQWKAFYQNSHLTLAQAESDTDDTSSYPSDDNQSDQSESESEQTDQASGQQDQASDTSPPMLLVDVVLLSTQELMSTAKGVNLLNALTLQLGSTSGSQAAYSRVTSSTAVSGSPRESSTAITRAVTVPALSYSMNIANANNSVNEVLARPTLAAIEGMPSEFFSGTNLSAGIVSTSQEGGTTIVPLEKSFGIKLAVTPNFLPQGRVQLKVEAQRTSLNANSDNPRVAYQIEIGETTANANVVMNLGETLVLSGLSEKSSSTTRDGVPGLQDVPGVQYLFSNKKTNQLQRSVLILVTPRAPMLIADNAEGERRPADVRMQELRKQFGFTDNTPANVDAIMNQLQNNDHFREFRQSDVALERWDRVNTTGERLKEALGFLYY